MGKIQNVGNMPLRHYLNVKTNIATITTFVERLAMVSNNSKSANIVSPTTMIDLEVVATAVNSIQNQNERSRLDIYLLTSHPSAGNTLYNTYHKEFFSKEVEAVRKEVETSKKSVTSHPRGRGRGRGRGNEVLCVLLPL
jgi:hypothetical protein